MDHMSLWVFISISIPEEFVFAALTALIVGRKDVFKKNWPNALRLILVTVLTALSTLLLRYVPIISDSMRVLAQVLIFIALYVVILRLKYAEAAIGFLIALVAFMVIEFASFVVVTQITGITVLDSQKSDLTRFLYFLPERILQIGLLIVLVKMPFTLINLSNIKAYSIKIIRKISILHICLFITFIFIYLNTKHYMVDNPIYRSGEDMVLAWFSLIYSIVVAVTMIIISIKLSKALVEQERRNIGGLLWVRTLLREYPGDIIKITQIIEDAIQNERGIGDNEN